MNFLKSWGFGGGGGGSSCGGNLPYRFVSEEAETAYDHPRLKLLQAEHKTTKARVTIFQTAAEAEAADETSRNFLQKMKTLRHPNILAFLDGVELPNDKGVLVVTEEVLPLKEYLSQLRNDPQKQSSTNSPQQQNIFSQFGPKYYTPEQQIGFIWGLKSILSALCFLHTECKLLHGSISPNSIFVTKGGDWKLGGFDITTDIDSATSAGNSLFLAHEAILDTIYKSPERIERNWSGISAKDTFAIDIYSMGMLTYFVYGGAEFDALTANSIQRKNNLCLPKQWSSVVDRHMICLNPSSRFSASQLLKKSFFQLPFISKMEFLETLAIQDRASRQQFYENLLNDLEWMPSNVIKYKVFPALKKVVDIAMGGDCKSSTSRSTIKLDPVDGKMLPVLAKIASAYLSEEEVTVEFIPILVGLFASSDRSIRLQLLNLLDGFACFFDSKLVNSSFILDNLCSGFRDSSPVVREQTLKSIFCLAPKLTESNLSSKILTNLAKLQADPEAAIRTNTVICVGKLAPFMSEKTRAKVLTAAFLRTLRKDSFAAARLASLKAIRVCAEQSFFTAKELTDQLIGGISCVSLDTNAMVRTEAHQTILYLLQEKVMKVYHTEMVEMEKEKEAKEIQDKVIQEKKEKKVDRQINQLDSAILNDHTNNCTEKAVLKTIPTAPSTSISNSILPAPVSSSSSDFLYDEEFRKTVDDVDDGWGNEDEDLLDSPKKFKTLNNLKKNTTSTIATTKTRPNSLPVVPSKKIIKKVEEDNWDDWAF